MAWSVRRCSTIPDQFHRPVKRGREEFALVPGSPFQFCPRYNHVSEIPMVQVKVDGSSGEHRSTKWVFIFFLQETRLTLLAPANPFIQGRRTRAESLRNTTRQTMSRLSCTLLMVNAFAAAFVPICPEGTRHVGVHAPHQSTFRHRGFAAAPVSAGTAARSTPADAGPGLGEDSGEKTPSSADSAGIQLEKLSRRGTDFLSGSSWILKLDIGREDGTWMDARWGNSGQRVRAAVAVTLEPNGSVSILNDYQYGLQRRLPDAVGVRVASLARTHDARAHECIQINTLAHSN